MSSTTPSILRLDKQALKILAQPLRSRLLVELRMHGPATATELARRLETNTGATSYHLRKLASVGLVSETNEGHGRERPWRAATDMHSWEEHEAAGDADAEAATNWLRHNYLRFFVERYEHWLDVQPSWPIEWQDAAGASDFALHLTAARLADFQADVMALAQRYRDLPPASAQGDEEVVQIHLYAFPLEAERR